MVAELAGKKVKLDFQDESNAYGVLAGANGGFFKLVGEDGSATYYNIAHVLSVEENDGSDADLDDDDDEEMEEAQEGEVMMQQY